MRTEEIKSIEIIAHPPAEYDAGGTGGIINIILKKQTRSGLNGSVYSNYSQGKYAGTSEGLQLNFKKGRLGLFGNYSYSRDKGFDNLNQMRTFPNRYYSAENRGINHNEDQHLHLGATYDITANQYLAIDYTGSFSVNTESFTALTHINYPGNSTENAVSRGLFPSKYNSTYNDAGLNYHLKTYSVGSEFIFLSDYTVNNSNNNNTASSSFYDSENNFVRDTSYRNQTPSRAKIFTADAKYKHAFNITSNLSFGAKVSATDIYNEARFDFLKNENWIGNVRQNFIYDYKENILAAYINYAGKILNNDVQIGFRGENTSFTGALSDSTGNTKNSKQYFGLFPQHLC